jgi:hypothetical protein
VLRLLLILLLVSVAGMYVLLLSNAGSWQKDGEGGEKFGVRVMASGPSLLQLDNVAMSHCGQAGLGR